MGWNPPPYGLNLHDLILKKLPHITRELTPLGKFTPV